MSDAGVEPAPGGLAWRWLGRIPYDEALAMQEEVLRERPFGGDRLLLLEHDPVYTTGRGGAAENLPPDRPGGVPVYRVGRGGDATYHGPGQLVGYPLVDLRRRGGDVHRFLRAVEEGLIATLRELRVAGHRRPGWTGVWVDPNRPRKIASIGIGVRRGITWHGFALNVTVDLGRFDAIVPCAIPGVQMTSLERERSEPPPSLSEIATLAARHLGARVAALTAPSEAPEAEAGPRPEAVRTG